MHWQGCDCDGYICGGYTDVAWCGGADWKSSTESFLFSLKDHTGVSQVKMPIKSDQQQAGYAVVHNSCYGPTFGDDCDVYVASNANANTGSFCSAGDTYQLPSNINEPHFLTGSKHFTVSEYEVFLF